MRALRPSRRLQHHRVHCALPLAMPATGDQESHSPLSNCPSLPAGPAPLGSCGVAVAAACQLPPGVVARAAEVAERAEQAGRPAERPALLAGTAASSPGRQPLAELNPSQQPGLPPPAKRQRLEAAAGAAAAAAAGGSASVALMTEQCLALAAVKDATLAALAGAPGAAAQLANLQAAVRAALAAGQL